MTSENSYLGLEGETIVVYDNQTEIGRLPLHNLEGIVSFGYRGTSPALMGACAERDRSILPSPLKAVSNRFTLFAERDSHHVTSANFQLFTFNLPPLAFGC